MENKFKKELEQLINKYSMENDSNTPDFILAEYLIKCLDAFNVTLQRREAWYGRDFSSKKVPTAEDEAIILEKAAYDHNYNNYCARLTLGILPAITPYDLLGQDYGRVRSDIEINTIRDILRKRNACYDVSKNAYDDWEITLVITNGCPCGHNGKTLPSNSTIKQVRVGNKLHVVGQRVRNDGVIEKFSIYNTGRVEAVVAYNRKCPFQSYFRSIDIVNL